MIDLGLEKAPSRSRVVVAMSGGVDSSAVAALLVEAGYAVIGVTLQLYDHGKAVGRKGTCCAGQDIHDARRVADRLSIPHYVLDFEARFRAEVIERFADSYAVGETPVPCVLCNETVKFRDLLAIARDLEADALATGHYARRVEGGEGPELHAAADGTRDQSYFLYRTTREQLRHLRFPLGAQAKDETRAIARAFDLPVAAKSDSQDICFVPEGNYARVVERLRPGAVEPGEVVDLEGRVLGRHDGIMRFTVGQRRGLGVSGSEPLYVVRLEPSRRRVVVGPRAALGRQRVVLRAVNWLGDGTAPPVRWAGTVKLRSTMSAVAATMIAGPAGEAVVELDEPQYGIAAGQACVFYDGDRVLGGGWIGRERSEAAA
ncbi:MAG: tRNA 2-thiouridine(34) synthase MnmA [Alphaproteobacteria bacterium]